MNSTPVTRISRSFDFELGAVLGIAYLAANRRVTFDYPHRLLTIERESGSPSQ